MSSHSRPQPVQSQSTPRPSERSNSSTTKNVVTAKHKKQKQKNTRVSSVDIFADAKRRTRTSITVSTCIVIFVIVLAVAAGFIFNDVLKGQKEKSFKEGFSSATSIQEGNSAKPDETLRIDPSTIFTDAKAFPGSGIPDNANLKKASIQGMQIPRGSVSSSYAEVGLCITAPGSSPAPFTAVMSTANFKKKSPEWTVSSVVPGGKACVKK